MRYYCRMMTPTIGCSIGLFTCPKTAVLFSSSFRAIFFCFADSSREKTFSQLKTFISTLVSKKKKKKNRLKRTRKKKRCFRPCKPAKCVAKCLTSQIWKKLLIRNKKIRFVLLEISFLQCDLICQDSDFWQIGAVQQLTHLFALRYDLSCCWTLVFHYDMICQTTAKLVRKLGKFVSFCNGTLVTPYESIFFFFFL